jgi:hypothetical protein
VIDLNELEIEFTEVTLSETEYEERVVRLVKQLLKIDQDVLRGQDEAPIEVAA